MRSSTIKLSGPIYPGSPKCEAITGKGARCKRFALHDGLCKQHAEARWRKRRQGEGSGS